ncbi:hypothetical protein SNE40_014496 [Patella caerulea]|uniref:Cytochrome P450 n=2 Tax=Patella caerulea TaxID=87958 RepID=A0AAN8JK76_PATCE
MFEIESLPIWISVPLSLIILVIILVATAYIYTTWTHTIFKKMGIPDPTPGLMGMLPLHAEKGIIELDLEVTKKYGPVSGIFIGRLPAMLISDTGLIKQIFVQEFSNFVNRNQFVPNVNIMKRAIANVEDNEWRAMRSVISPTFSSGKMRDMSSLINMCVGNMVDSFGEKVDPIKSVKLDEICQAYTMDVIAATAFGIDADCQKNPEFDFFVNAKKTLQFSFSAPIVVLCLMFPILTDICDYFNLGYMPRDCVKYFTDTVHHAIQERKQETSNKRDLLQLMLNTHKESTNASAKQMTEDEILANSLFFIMAGFDTTSITLGFALHCLATNPEIQDKAYEEITQKIGKEAPTYDNLKNLTYIDMIISETLRMYPAATRLNRRANNDTNINGYDIPNGMIIMVPIYTIHRDPAHWEDPDKFVPERFSAENKDKINPYAYMPFGLGPRNCVGMRLANLVTKMAIVALLQNFRFIQSPETEVTPKLSKGGFVRSENGIYLRIERRNV